jgi:hypothetical protein
MLKFYARLADMESKNETKFKLLKSAFAEDKKLYLIKSTCWVQPLHQLKGLLNLQSLDISFLEFKLAIENYLRNKVPDQLEHIKSSNEGKLRFYNNICSSFDLKDYLQFNLTRSGRSLLTKIRESAHSLEI